MNNVRPLRGGSFLLFWNLTYILLFCSMRIVLGMMLFSMLDSRVSHCGAANASDST
jgi:hypothetical protein